MTLPVFRRLTERLLDRLGEQSFLRGEPDELKVNIEHGVEVYSSHDEATFVRSVATIPNTAAPRQGDVLVHPEGTFKLDFRVLDNGYSSRYVILPYTAL